MLARCFTIDSRITAWSGGTMIMTHPGVRQGRDTSPSRSHSHRRGCCSDSRRWLSGRQQASLAPPAPLRLCCPQSETHLGCRSTPPGALSGRTARRGSQPATPPHIRAMGRSVDPRGQTHMTRETGLHLVSLGFRVCGSLPVPRLSPTHWCLRHARTLRDLGACGSNVKEGSGLDRSLVGR